MSIKVYIVVFDNSYFSEYENQTKVFSTIAGAIEYIKDYYKRCLGPLSRPEDEDLKKERQEVIDYIDSLEVPESISKNCPYTIRTSYCEILPYIKIECHTIDEIDSDSDDE